MKNPKENEWICNSCGNINKNDKVFCKCCGKFKPSTTIFRLIYILLTIIIITGFSFWFYNLLTDKYSNIEWSKIIVILFTSALPISMFLIGSVFFIVEYIKTIELRNNPNKLLHSDPEIRKDGVKLMENEKDILNLLKTETNSSLRQEAVSKLKNSEDIKEFALKDKDSEVRKKALSMIFDEDLIFEIAKTDKSSQVRQEALKKLFAQKNIIEIAKTDVDFNVRKEAIKKIIDQTALVEIAENEENSEVEEEAIKRIKNPLIITEIIQARNQKLINTFTSKLPVIRDINYFEEQLKELYYPYKKEKWFFDSYSDFLLKLKNVPKNDFKTEEIIVTVKLLGTLNKNMEIEKLIKNLVTENQYYFNRYLESNINIFDEMSKDTITVVKSLYTGQNSFILKK